MRLKIIFVLAQYVSFCLYDSAKALIGQQFRRVSPNEFFDIVTIMTVTGDRYDIERDLMCTGTLITGQDILTTEYCLKNKLPVQIHVYLGNGAITNNLRCYVQWWITYDAWAELNSVPVLSRGQDITIMRLALPVTLISPAVMGAYHKSALIGREIQTAGRLVASNNQPSNIVITAFLRVIPDVHCSDIIRRISGVNINIDEALLCSNAQPSMLLSRGDIGGPVYVDDKLVAVNKGTYPLLETEFHPEKVNVHYNIATYLDFIYAVTNA